MVRSVAEFKSFCVREFNLSCCDLRLTLGRAPVYNTDDRMLLVRKKLPLIHLAIARDTHTGESLKSSGQAYLFNHGGTMHAVQ